MPRTLGNLRHFVIGHAAAVRDHHRGGEVAVAHKKFDGVVRLADGKEDVLDWQTLYFCRKNAGRWQITGFVGYIRDRAGA